MNKLKGNRVMSQYLFITLKLIKSLNGIYVICIDPKNDCFTK